MCTKCAEGYVIATNKQCYLKQNKLTNCIEANSSTECKTCITGKVIVNSECKEPAITDCATYEQNRLNSNQKCTTCTSGYYSNSSKTTCTKGSIAFCDSYSSSTSCSNCNTGYELVTSDSKQICLPINGHPDCSDYDSTLLQIGKLKCTQCANSFLIRDWSTPKSICNNFTVIANCVSYHRGSAPNLSFFNCTKCDPTHYLSSDSSSCTLRTHPSIAKCTIYSLNKDQCSTCESDYFLTENNTKCQENPSGLTGCSIYKNASECSQCFTDLYLDDNKRCQKVTTLIENCLYYSAIDKCSNCKPDYFLSNNTCILVKAKKCLVAESVTKCSSCPSGWGLQEEVVAGETLLSCVTKPTINGCSLVSSKAPFKCEVCDKFTYLDNGACVSVAQTDLITNCLIY